MPSKSKWLLTKKLESTFRPVGTAYIVGRVCRRLVQNRAVLYEIRWLDSIFQKHTHSVPVGVLQEGIENYRLLTKTTSKPSWAALTTAQEDEDIPSDVVLEELEEVEGDLAAFDPDQPLPITLKEVEAVKGMRFDPRIQMNVPPDLYNHSDGSTATRVRSEFTHSASSSFLAYTPIYFWQQVVNESNAYAKINGVNLVQPVTLAELMQFIGILFFMTINDKGEYANYWGPNPKTQFCGIEIH
ncbi:hypothetical protein JG688_00017877 [Phytophthora aleatoria]|uniref:PiggyBac transposable element-derived protein domain-containing protein n=1 Tax=Phytophthora aleatoria TaxID=2496075 RepID=A0A8J5LV20_9STRA|nr:hypothetical protein JG688_00017877 [Phytophthora aleatoria]